MTRPTVPVMPHRAVDQADGLRRRFGHATRVHVPLVANSQVKAVPALLERVSTCFTMAGHTTLLVDAASQSPAPGELSFLELGACVERLDDRTRYLPARGLIRGFVDSRGSAARMLDALADAAPDARVVLVHGDASDLARVFAGQDVQPILLGGESALALQEAYAGAKILSSRAGLMNFDLVLSARPQGARAAAVTEALNQCMDRFLGALLRQWACIDPAGRVSDEPPATLVDMLAWQLRARWAAPVPRVGLPGGTTVGLGARP